MSEGFRSGIVRGVAAAIIVALWAVTRLPELDPEERAALAARFAFSQHALAEWRDGPRRTRRPVNPSLERHSGWMSAVGAAVALADLDGDGLANDVCHVDPRTDRVSIAPAPGTGDRYPLFVLPVDGVPYEAATTAPMGCVPSDMNEDGRIDLLVYHWGRTPLVYLRRGEGPPGVSDYVPVELVASGERWYTNAAVFADLDGDGHADLLIGNYFQDGARILDASATEPDFMQHSMSRAFNAGRNRVLRFVSASRGPEPGVRYEEVRGLFAERVDQAWTLAIGTADLDGDLRPEIYYANDFGPDRLFHNRSTPGELRFALLEGERRLTDPRSKVLGRDSFKGMGVDFADVNGDGHLDFFVSNIAAEYALEESHFLFVHTGDVAAMRDGVAPYTDESEPLGVPRSDWSWDTRFGDFDNDGVPEALQATGFHRGRVDRWPELQELATGNDELLKLAGSWPRFQAGDDLSGHAVNPFYVRSASGRYFDLAADLGIDDGRVTRGIATADVDGDGDLDFAVANQWDESFLFRNERGASGDFLGLRLLLPVGDEPVARPRFEGAGRPAIGASVRVERAGRVLVGQVDGGNGHSGVRSPELHFGLGREGGSSPVTIRYRDRAGRAAELALDLEPGWHTVVLPDATETLALGGPVAGGAR